MEKEIERGSEIKSIADLKRREWYDVDEFIKQVLLQHGYVRCWGCIGEKDEKGNQVRIIKHDGVLELKVEALKFKGKVFISVDWNDTFIVYFVKNNIVHHISKNMYFDMVVGEIDSLIEDRDSNQNIVLCEKTIFEGNRKIKASSSSEFDAFLNGI